MSYESEITILPKREVVIVTKLNPRLLENPPEDGLLAKAEWHYPSPEALRKSLIKQKFYAEVAKAVNDKSRYIAVVGYALAFVSHILPASLTFNAEWAIRDVGIGIGTVGLLLEGKPGTSILDYKKRVDSRVKAFNETDSGLQPVTFSPRDYLSAIRIPFRR